jgi:hypothetical protein
LPKKSIPKNELLGEVRSWEYSLSLPMIIHVTQAHLNHMIVTLNGLASVVEVAKFSVDKNDKKL